MGKGTARFIGSCGELIQGWIDGSQKLVSCGIDRYSYATVADYQISASQAGSKAKAAMRETLRALDISETQLNTLHLNIHSDLPQTKGMASSTADIAAACLATADYFGQTLSLETLVKICIKIERTDSVLFPDLTVFEQENGKTVLSSNWQPSFYVLVLEPEAKIETRDFHTKAVEASFYQQRHQFCKVYETYLEAVKQRSFRRLTDAAFESALLNQERMFKPFFYELAELREEFSWLGINAAHSGSVMGLLFEDIGKLDLLMKRLKELGVMEIYPKIRLQKSCYTSIDTYQKRNPSKMLLG